MKKIYFLTIIVALSFTCFYAYHMKYSIKNLVSNKEECNNQEKRIKNKNYFDKNITALVFFGRKQSVEILIKYLIVNLRKNGGILDRIKFAVKTKNTDDLNYLNELIKLYPNDFSRAEFNTFASMYDLIENDEYFFKIDDDIVFIKNETFENMFIEYTSKNHMFLSANVVNHPRLSEIHASYGAIKPVCKNSICKTIL